MMMSLKLALMRRRSKKLEKRIKELLREGERLECMCSRAITENSTIQARIARIEQERALNGKTMLWK